MSTDPWTSSDSSDPHAQATAASTDHWLGHGLHYSAAGTPYVEVPGWIIDAVDPLTLRVYVGLLCRHPTVRPKLAVLAEELGYAERTVQRAMSTLRSVGAMLASPGEVVYLIGDPSRPLAKIGRTVQLSRRLREIQSMSPVPVSVLWSAPGGADLEGHLHAAFADRRAHGEWFNFGDDDPVAAMATEVVSYLQRIARIAVSDGGAA